MPSSQSPKRPGGEGRRRGASTRGGRVCDDRRLVPLPARSPESLVVLGSIVLLALHVLDDALVQPEPGTSAGDHVLYAAVFCALLAGAAVLYFRVRPGARAAIAALLAVVSLTYAGLAVGEALGQGLAGHDYTGLVLFPSGLALAGLAPVELWRSRKSGGSRGMRYARRALVGTAAILLLFVVAAPVALGIAVTHRPRAEVTPADLGRPYEQVTLRTADGLDLAGWYVPSRNGAAVIVFPGRGSRVPHARLLARAGYGVLMLDMRGQGESEGDPNMLGWDSGKDLDAAIAFLEARPDVERGRIGGIGFSVGGELMIQAAAENEGLDAVVSEGAGERSVRESLLQGPGGWWAIPSVAVSNLVVGVIAGDAPPPSLEELVARISPRPLFLIYARRGAGGENLNPKYFEAAGEPKQIWEIATGGHTGGLAAEGGTYERRVLAFFRDALLG